MTLTILSSDGTRRAVVSATEDGASVAYYRRLFGDDSRGHAPSATRPPTGWRYLRTAVIPRPFHVALDTACNVLEVEP